MEKIGYLQQNRGKLPHRFSVHQDGYHVMTKVFIIRPFGKKRVTVPNPQGNDALVDVDFNQIDKDLIQAALIKNNLKGDTTELIASAGNIRVDMFKMLIA
jgi:hypothetical protein